MGGRDRLKKEDIESSDEECGKIEKIKRGGKMRYKKMGGRDWRRREGEGETDGERERQMGRERVREIE